MVTSVQGCHKVDGHKGSDGMNMPKTYVVCVQVPVLFTGTMRSNLDPFERHNDMDIWAALRRAHLARVVESNPLGLEMTLAEGGAPLSAGQKQLVALARALLRNSKACFHACIVISRILCIVPSTPFVLINGPYVYRMHWDYSAHLLLPAPPVILPFPLSVAGLCDIMQVCVTSCKS